MSSVMDRPIRRRAIFARRYWIPLVVLAALAIVLSAIALINDGRRSVRVDRARLGIATVERGTFYDFVPLRGKAVPRDIVYLDAQEGGRVERVAVHAGDFVSDGQLLVEFGNTALQLEVIDRESIPIQQINALRSSQIQLEQSRIANIKALAEVDHNIAQLRHSVERRVALGSASFIPTEERDDLEEG